MAVEGKFSEAVEKACAQFSNDQVEGAIAQAVVKDVFAKLERLEAEGGTVRLDNYSVLIENGFVSPDVRPAPDAPHFRHAATWYGRRRRAESAAREGLNAVIRAIRPTADHAAVLVQEYDGGDTHLPTIQAGRFDTAIPGVQLALVHNNKRRGLVAVKSLSSRNR